jgi:hypothetical protein
LNGFVSSLRVRKRHCERCIRMHPTVSTTGCVFWASILHLEYSISALRAGYTYLGGPHLVGKVGCYNGRTTLPASSERQFMRLCLSHPRFPYPDGHVMCDNSLAGPGRRALICSRCVSATWDDRCRPYVGWTGRRDAAGGIVAPAGRAI